MLLTWWPWPLTYDLDHQSRPRFYQGQSLCQILWPNIKWFGRESADILTHRQTHIHTEGSVFLTSTADAGGKKQGSFLNAKFSMLSCKRDEIRWTGYWKIIASRPAWVQIYQACIPDIHVLRAPLFFNFYGLGQIWYRFIGFFFWSVEVLRIFMHPRCNHKSVKIHTNLY